jgi:hypothetical protein
MRIVIAGMVAADPYQGGATWAVLQYALGFKRLGHDVFVLDSANGDADAQKYFAGVRRRFRLEAAMGPYDGPIPDVLVNISGTLRDSRLDRVPIRVYVDLDPVFNQLWHLEGIDVGFEGHTHYVSLGTRLPSCGIEWIPTFPPVVLDQWPVADRVLRRAFTTVANWRSYGVIEQNGTRYGQKAHSMRRFLDLPRLSGEQFELAIDIDPGDVRDVDALHEHGWRLLDPRDVAGDPASYAAFVRGSRAEFGIAKEGYVVSRSGWFSDRSACYLASGRPVLAQDTGFGERLPVGAGLFAFETTDDALAGIDALRGDYGRHSRAARAIAEEFLDSDRVLMRLLEEVGAIRRAGRRRVSEAAEDELTALVGSRIVTRRPSPYRSSAPVLELELEDGRQALIKDLSRCALTASARSAKPEFLYDPLREIVVYESLLHSELGTAGFYGAAVEPERDRYWLALEKVRGVELYQVDELRFWRDAMRWLARFHDRFRGKDLCDSLIRYDSAYFQRWAERAREFAALTDLRWHGQLVDRLASLPATLLHGDLYASNVLVANGRICPVDWELAGIGPGVIDLAALTMGWPDDEQRELVSEYYHALEALPAEDEFARDLDFARLHLAVQWLGWSRNWSPPPEHTQDFRAQIAYLTERLEL